MAQLAGVCTQNSVLEPCVDIDISIDNYPMRCCCFMYVMSSYLFTPRERVQKCKRFYFNGFRFTVNIRINVKKHFLSDVTSAVLLILTPLTWILDKPTETIVQMTFHSKLT